MYKIIRYWDASSIDECCKKLEWCTHMTTEQYDAMLDYAVSEWKIKQDVTSEMVEHLAAKIVIGSERLFDDIEYEMISKMRMLLKYALRYSVEA